MYNIIIIILLYYILYIIVLLLINYYYYYYYYLNYYLNYLNYLHYLKCYILNVKCYIFAQCRSFTAQLIWPCDVQYLCSVELLLRRFCTSRPVDNCAEQRNTAQRLNISMLQQQSCGLRHVTSLRILHIVLRSYVHDMMYNSCAASR